MKAAATFCNKPQLFKKIPLFKTTLHHVIKTPDPCFFVPKTGTKKEINYNFFEGTDLEKNNHIFRFFRMRVYPS